MDSDLAQLIGERIRLLRSRIRPKMSQKKLAEAIGVEPITIYRWESGKSVPEKDNLDTLARIFKVPYSFFFDGDKATEWQSMSQRQMAQVMLSQAEEIDELKESAAATEEERALLTGFRHHRTQKENDLCAAALYFATKDKRYLRVFYDHLGPDGEKMFERLLSFLQKK